MKLTAFFELWHLGDGNYPPFHKGQLVNLSFQLFPKSLEKPNSSNPQYFDHQGESVYRFSGKVLKTYGDENYPFIVVEANGFRFYIDDTLAKGFCESDDLVGEGALGLDTYYWVESLDRYKEPPNLFYNLKVTRITKVYHPQLMQSLDSQPESTEEEIEDMNSYDAAGESVLDGSAHCVVDFISDGLEGEHIPRTFI